MLSTSSFFPSASSMSLNMLPAMPLTMRLSPWNGFGQLIPIPLQPKAASSRLPWLCLRIWERRECLGCWVWVPLYGPHLCTCLSQAPLPVCFLFPGPLESSLLPVLFPHLCSLTAVNIFLSPSLSPECSAILYTLPSEHCSFLYAAAPMKMSIKSLLDKHLHKM